MIDTVVNIQFNNLSIFTLNLGNFYRITSSIV